MAECIRTVEASSLNAARTTSSYVIRVVGTENGTWQGELEHVQTGTKTTFRSCLQMLKVMESALELKPEAKPDETDSELA